MTYQFFKGCAPKPDKFACRSFTDKQEDMGKEVTSYLKNPADHKALEER